MILVKFLEAVLTVLGAAYLYMGLFTAIGLFATRRFARTANLHRYAIVIAARNEENVIGQLLSSIRSQTYPARLVTVFVVADNCTDRTAQIARENGAICYERHDTLHRTKGFALQFLFRRIERDYGIDSFEGYFVFDADNILKPDYIEKMNRAFDAGEKIITSYRNTKNWGRSCVAASYAIHWMRTNRCENRAKSVLHMACHLQGTGFLFSRELVKNGWNYTDLTEDRSFCADAVRMGYRITYQDEAEFYDEQPENLPVALRQRIRWSKGHLQAFMRLGPSLFKRCFSTKLQDAATAYDMLMLNFPSSLVHLLLEILQLLACVWAVCLSGRSPAVLNTWITGALLSVGGEYIGNAALAVYTLIMERRHIPSLPWYKLVWYCLTFPMFSFIGTVTACAAAVSRVEWKPIPHHAVKASRKPVMRKAS